ncbi:sulfotransferase family protein [Marixanthomonas spongiae]|uniref:sulfotransferase family protein n=1 Tax=Marixanthomonas spongiae TaxID=2174845 RepID=UPI0014031D75|nr:sulfotransferase family protein [Marixanthomonas spongiae]
MKRYNKHLVVLGSARSGTSWFSELIAQQHRYRMLFEPEHEFNTKNGKLICDRYITEKNTSKPIKHYLKRVFANRVDSDWIAQLSNRKWKRHLWPFIPKKFIIKFVRCNLAAGYLANHFNIPVVFIVRNPYDVLASQQRVKFPWLYNLSWFTGQEDLCKLINETYGIDITALTLKSNLEKLCFRWCIENSVPFLDSKKRFKVYKYENIKADINLFLNICKEHRLEPLKNIDSVYRKPSSKTHPKSTIITGKNKPRPFTAEEYALINHYLDRFSINLYAREH